MSVDPRLLAAVNHPEGREHALAEAERRLRDAVMAGEGAPQVAQFGATGGRRMSSKPGESKGQVSANAASTAMATHTTGAAHTSDAANAPVKRADPFGPIPLSERTNEVIYIGRTHSVRESISKFYCFKATFPELTSAVTRCYNLMSLRVVKSGLEVLPEAIGDLARHGMLRELTFDFNNLTRIPESISRLTTLERLSVSHNHLCALPISLGRLTRCNMLNVAHNRLRDLPESTRQLTALDELYLQSNELRSLPSHGDPGGPGDFPAGAGPTALSSRRASTLARSAQRATEEFREKVVASKTPREIIYWLGRVKEEYTRGAMDCLTLEWLDSIASKLGRHRGSPTAEQIKAGENIDDNIKMLRAAKGMKAEGLKKELRARHLDSSYSGSKRELLQRLEKFVRNDNKKNALILKGIWLADVETAFVNVLSIVSPHNVG
jgi:Leucine-rich repeat (LRR) protein